MPKMQQSRKFGACCAMQRDKGAKKTFAKELLIKMLKRKPREVDQIGIFDMIEDVLKYSNKDKEGDFKTS